MIAINASVSYLWSCRLVLQTAWAIVGYYRVVQLNFTPEIEVFYLLFEISLPIFSMTSLKQHIECLNFRCKIQSDLHVVNYARSRIFILPCTELANKVCPRLRDSACWRSGEMTQPT